MSISLSSCARNTHRYNDAAVNKAHGTAIKIPNGLLGELCFSKSDAPSSTSSILGIDAIIADITIIIS